VSLLKLELDDELHPLPRGMELQQLTALLSAARIAEKKNKC
jgi:hypothetical protein